MKIVTGRTGVDHVTSSDAREFNAGILGKGFYVLDIGAKLAYSIQTANSIIISNGNIVMNGTQANIPYGSSETAAIENGSVGYKRIDLIVARYQNTGGIESVSLEVIKGTPTASTPTAPAYNQGNILDGDMIVDMPLYSVRLDGVNIDEVKQEFVVKTGMDDMFNLIYPIGSIYMSVNNVNPSTLFGGEWVAWGGGRVPVGVSTDEEFNTVEMTGGSKTTAYKPKGTNSGTALTVAQLPAHTHTEVGFGTIPNLISYQSGSKDAEIPNSASKNSGSTGSGQTHTHTFTGTQENISTVQPYITCYMWKRTE